MKKLVFTVTNDILYDQRMERICQTLSSAGYDVTIIGREKKGSKSLEHKSYRQQRLPMIFQKGKLFYIEYNLRLFFRLLFIPCDVICSIDLDTIVPCYYAAKMRNKVLVYDAHEYFTEVIEVVRRPGVKKIWEKIERTYLSRIKYAYTVNDSLKQLFENKYPLKFEVIRNVSKLDSNGVNKAEETEPYIIYAGAVNEGRGLDECIDAMQFLEVKLYICGDGDILQRLIFKVKEMELEHKVIFTGYLKPSDLRRMISKAWLGVLLLENKGLSYYYSLANKFFDYLHAGIPQVTVDFPEYKLLNAQHEVAVLTELKVENIVGAVKSLQRDPEQYRKLSENCLNARREWNWEKESQKLLGFYKSLK
ncbi:MAG: glycosyltransferase [Cytophagaceae bacterium]